MNTPLLDEAGTRSARLVATRSGRVLWLTLCRPERGNVLSLDLMAELRTALEAAYLDLQVKVIVLANEGHVFCAGHDLRQMRSGEGRAGIRAMQRRILETCRDLMLTILHGDKPVIACVGGIASAGGAQLVSACDLAVAADTATFCLPGVSLGAFCTTPLVGVGRNMHRKHAMEMALTGDMFSAADVLRFGLINRAVPEAELHSATKALAMRIASRSTEGIRQGKAAFYRQIDMSVEDAFLYGIEKMIDACTTGEAGRGIDAFLTKTTPVWQDEEAAVTPSPLRPDHKP